MESLIAFNWPGFNSDLVEKPVDVSFIAAVSCFTLYLILLPSVFVFVASCSC